MFRSDIYILLVLIVLSDQLSPIICQLTIGEIIRQRTELSMIQQYMQGTDTWNKLTLQQTAIKYTFFAPHNRAFLNVSEQVRAALDSPLRSVSFSNDIFSYHTATGEWRTTAASAASNSVVRIQSLGNGAPKLFLVAVVGEVFINGARFIEANVETATNGVLHVIDRIFLDPHPTSNAYKYITDTAAASSNSQDHRTSEFASLLATYVNYVSYGSIRPTSGLNVRDSLLNDDNQLVTAFVPSNAALSRFSAYNGDRYRAMRNAEDLPLLQKVVESHVIPFKPYHSNILETLGQMGVLTSAVRGRVRVYRLNGALYVSNDCVQSNITVSNITTSNGVVYIIDNLFGFVYNDALTQIRRDVYSLNEFGGTVDAAPDDVHDLLRLPDNVNSDSIPEDRKLTVFAPVDAAFRSNDFSIDTATSGKEIRQHIVYGVIEVFRMVNGTTLPTLRDGNYVRFYQFGDARYVEVNYVRARIVESGICVRNGIIHKIDHILGIPGRNILQEIAENPRLRSLYEVVINTRIQHLVGDEMLAMSMFAPVDFTPMRQTSLGISLLDNTLMRSRLENLLRRHIAKGYKFLDETVSGDTVFETYYDSIVVTRDFAGEFYVLIGTLRIHVSRPNIRVKNGVVHIIDRVIFDPEDPRTGVSISGSPSSRPWTVSASVCVLITALTTLWGDQLSQRL